MPAIVPCLLENEADYEAMSNCPEDELFLEDKMILSAFIHLFDHLKTWREMFNITIDFLDTVNDLVCTRTDGKARNIYVFYLLFFSFIMQALPCNFQPLTSHFYILQLEFIGVYINYLYFFSKMYIVRTR